MYVCKYLCMYDIYVCVYVCMCVCCTYIHMNLKVFFFLFLLFADDSPQEGKTVKKTRP